MIVLDSSAFLGCLLPDEIIKQKNSLLDEVANQQTWVPHLFFLEISNSLWTAEKRKRLDRDTRTSLLECLGQLPFNIDNQAVFYAFNKISDLASTQNLSVYDATYLELAIRLKAKLATQDQQLLAAAHQLKVEIYPL
jgi:predicted nucleic acid-binding protein